MRAQGGERPGRRRAGAAMALVVVVAFIGVGVALVVAGGALGLGITLVNYGDSAIGLRALQAPGVVLALGTELIAAALLLGWRVGARITIEEDEGHGPVVG